MKKILLGSVFLIFTDGVAMDFDSAKEILDFEKIECLMHEITGTQDSCWTIMDNAKSGDAKAQSAIRVVVENCDLKYQDVPYVIAIGFFEKNDFYITLVKDFLENLDVKSSLIHFCVHERYFSCLNELLFSQNLTVDALLAKAQVDDISVLRDRFDAVWENALADNILALECLSSIYSGSFYGRDAQLYKSMRESIQNQADLLDKLFQLHPHLANMKERDFESLGVVAPILPSYTFRLIEDYADPDIDTILLLAANGDSSFVERNIKEAVGTLYNIRFYIHNLEEEDIKKKIEYIGVFDDIVGKLVREGNQHVIGFLIDHIKTGPIGGFFRKIIEANIAVARSAIIEAASKSTKISYEEILEEIRLGAFG